MKNQLYISWENESALYNMVIMTVNACIYDGEVKHYFLEERYSGKKHDLIITLRSIKTP